MLPNRFSVTGIDPGLNDTGVVNWFFNQHTSDIFMQYRLIHHATPNDVVNAFASFGGYVENPHVFIEAYRPRAHMAQDQRMIVLCREIHQQMGGSKLLPNTGIKSVIKPALLGLFNARMFPVTTSHDDLVSAARIGLLGALKNPEINKLIAEIVDAYIHGTTVWRICTRP